jgi:hypothetical protein
MADACPLMINFSVVHRSGDASSSDKAFCPVLRDLLQPAW